MTKMEKSNLIERERGGERENRKSELVLEKKFIDSV